MDGLIEAIRKSSGNDEDLKKLAKKMEGQEKIMRKNQGAIDTALAGLLSPKHHAYGFLELLASKAQTEYKDHNLFVEQARALCLQGDHDQLRMAPKKLALVCRRLRLSAGLVDAPIRGIAPLQMAIRIIQGSRSNLLTSAHSDFLLCCIQAKCYSAALPVVNAPVLEIEPKENGIEPIDYLTYWYYSGIVHIAYKKFPEALECFQSVLSISSQVLSAVQLEAYKKFVLCSLLVHGTLVPLPRQSISIAVLRGVEPLSQAYGEFAKAYARNVTAASKVLEEVAESFQKDGNLGLAKQTIESFKRRNIQGLTRTYVTLSLADIARQSDLPPPQAESQLLKMIEAGQIAARINQKDGMLSFLEEAEGYDTGADSAALDSKLGEVMLLTRKMKEMNKSLILNPNYIIKTMPRESQEDRDMKAAMAASVGGL